MNDVRLNLAAIGFADASPEAVCWRTERIGPPQRQERRVRMIEPARSRALRQWRLRLAANPPRSPYRITRLG